MMFYESMRSRRYGQKFSLYGAQRCGLFKKDLCKTSAHKIIRRIAQMITTLVRHACANIAQLYITATLSDSRQLHPQLPC